MDHSSFTQKQREELTDLIAAGTHRAIDEYFLSKGRTWKGYVITVAVIVGSITVIFGGFKAMLAWLGIMLVHR